MTPEPHIPLTTADGHVRRLREIEDEAIVRAILFCGGNRVEAARRLGIGRSTLYRRMEEIRQERG